MKCLKGFKSDFLRESLRQNSDRILLRVVSSPGSGVVREFTGSQLLEAERDAARLPIPESSRVVLLLLPHSPELFLLQIGLTLGGKTPAVLPWPTTRVDGEKYQRNLLHQLSSLPADHLVTLPRLARNLGPCLEFPVTGCQIENQAHFEATFSDRFSGGPPQPSARGDSQPVSDDALFLQFSGGTTGTQKCVVVTAEMLKEQLSRLAAALDIESGDGVVSWLPLYHDMGLIACLYFPLWAGLPSIHFAAADWLMQPDLLFRFFQKYGGSMCWLPNFAFSYLVQRKDMMNGPYDLAGIRAWINCSEPVRRKSTADFAEQFREWGVSPTSVASSYAMAENVFAVTQSAQGMPLATVARSSVIGASSAYQANAFDLIDDVYVSSGRCLEGMQVRIVGPDGSILPDLEAGEIQLRTPCMFQGYWNRDGFRRDAFTGDGWYRTGDFGFLAGEELFVIGRIKDIIIVAGQNIFPEDVEVIASQVSGIYPGRIVAFGVDDADLETQSIGVVAEMRGKFEEKEAARMEREIRSQILASLAVAPRYISVVPQRWIVKSTAGKISRRDTRQRFLERLQTPIGLEA
jgi:acyl-CoA synthetase (AMP-forming)/AMP-acid ligase II